MSIIFSTQHTELDVKAVQPTAKVIAQPTRDNTQIAADIKATRDQFAKTEAETESRHALLKETLAQHDISLKFSKDDTTGKIVVELIDDKTGESVRQFPSKVSLRLSEIFTKIQGQFVEERV